MSEKEKKLDSAVLGTGKTEAWADAESVDPDTHVAVPKEEAMERAKEWVDDNEK
ncbi:CDIF630_02480 family spore surface protein [Anaerotalea alkaliphila]|uniref:DUF3787 domain-containing protein n=1 Tax=Anaerotalea alkaliphila TaxID=2662126 RepID=A0A7X5HVV9_9FIRM|nr:DUF3787 domain-containing protein [Anaerotalea alkaliphila]NDL67584.1 DUF3787 domain-containing protein [Anaerotalea alkaliphila]